MKVTSKNAFGSALAALLAWGVAGCGATPGIGTTTGGGGGTTPASGGATFVYVIQNPAGGTGEILQFAAGANGSVAPTATLTAPTGTQVTSVATDTSGQIYVAGYLPTSSFPVIEVYAAGASGAATPVRTINVSDLYSPTAMVVDSAGSLYTVNPNDGELFVYSSTANGAAAPTRLIAGALTQLNVSEGVAVDASGNIYVSSALLNGASATGAIYVFSSTATGNVAPLRTISNASGVFLGVATDSSGDLYAALDTIVSPYTGSIVEYAPGASGAAMPTRTIAGTATELSTAGGVRVDAAGSIYVANQIAGASSYSYVLDEFAPSATGNVAPVAALISSSWTNAAPEIAIK